MTFEKAVRRAGILLHPTSLPGPEGIGDLGANAYRFADFLHASGMTVWQMLPVGPTLNDGNTTGYGSPYSASSVHAGNPLLISIDRLRQEAWLQPDVGKPDAANWKTRKEISLQRSLAPFKQSAAAELRREYQQFVADNEYWILDFALYQAIRDDQSDDPWWTWPEPLRDRSPQAMIESSKKLRHLIEQQYFEQFLFQRQWQALKTYCHRLHIQLLGDLPIYPAHGSADVWANRNCFKLDEAGQPTVVAGVPPDYFSKTGQRWGNPLYDWSVLQEEEFAWWRDRVRTNLQRFDLLRLDHFRGLQACYQIPVKSETAENGCWQHVPGEQLLQKLTSEFPDLHLIAEDLGLVTKEVLELRDQFRLPGIRVLQFAFDGDSSNHYLPHNHAVNSLVCTGTHDNDTTLGWYNGLPDEQCQRIQTYLGFPSEDIPYALIRVALAAVAYLAILPMQDVLGLDSESRMNTPGTTQGNWHWRFNWSQVDAGLAGRLREMIDLYGRSPHNQSM